MAKRRAGKRAGRSQRACGSAPDLPADNAGARGPAPTSAPTWLWRGLALVLDEFDEEEEGVEDVQERSC